MDFFLLADEDCSPEIYQSLVSTGDWAPVFRDGGAWVILRRTPENQELIDRLAPSFRNARRSLTFPGA